MWLIFVNSFVANDLIMKFPARAKQLPLSLSRRHSVIALEKTRILLSLNHMHNKKTIIGE